MLEDEQKTKTACENFSFASKKADAAADGYRDAVTDSSHQVIIFVIIGLVAGVLGVMMGETPPLWLAILLLVAFSMSVFVFVVHKLTIMYITRGTTLNFETYRKKHYEFENCSHEPDSINCNNCSGEVGIEELFNEVKDYYEALDTKFLGVPRFVWRIPTLLAIFYAFSLVSFTLSMVVLGLQFA